MGKDQTFADYIANEADFVDIVMQIIASQMEHMPNPVSLMPNEGLNIF